MMCTQDTVLDVLGLFRGVGLSKVPDNEDAHQWLRVLNDVPAVLFEMAAEHYLKTPIEVKGHLRGVRYCPTGAGGVVPGAVSSLVMMAPSHTTATATAPSPNTATRWMMMGLCNGMRPRIALHQGKYSVTVSLGGTSHTNTQPSTQAHCPSTSPANGSPP
jgi:hypothetical protein